MKTLRRLVDRIRGEGLDGPASLTNALPVVQTSEVTIPAASNDVLNEELKGWADESGVMLEPVDGVWWRYGDLDGTLTSAREGKGLVGLQFHGGGYSIGSAKDVLSGGSRKSSGCHEIAPRCSRSSSVSRDTARFHRGEFHRIRIQLTSVLTVH